MTKEVKLFFVVVDKSLIKLSMSEAGRLESRKSNGRQLGISMQMRQCNKDQQKVDFIQKKWASRQKLLCGLSAKCLCYERTVSFQGH